MAVDDRADATVLIVGGHLGGGIAGPRRLVTAEMEVGRGSRLVVFGDQLQGETPTEALVRYGTIAAR